MASAPSSRRIAGVLTALVAFIGLLATTITPAAATPKPTVTQVMTTLDKLARKAETLTELFNKANEQVTAKQVQAEKAVQAATVAHTNFQSASGTLRASLIEQYRGSQFNSTSALMSSGSTQQYLDRLSMMSLLSHHREGVAASMKGLQAAAVKAQKSAAKQLSDARATRAALAKQRATVKKEQAKYSALLNTLTASQKKTYLGHGTASPQKYGPVHAPSKLAQIAVNFALAQLGKPYVFAAAGPGSYDCSGLTMAAWGKAGVHLSHYAPTQFTAGHRIPQSALAPGDLVFFYPDIGHVAMYIGHGMIIHAPQPGDVVKIVPLSTFASDYQGAVRLP